MKILVTGAAGYIGSVVAAELTNKGFSIIAVDDLRDGNKEAFPRNCISYEQDVGDSALIQNIFSTHKINAVMHFAASANVPMSVSDPYLYYQNNVYSTLVLLHNMVRAGIKHFIFSSTAAVYGEPVYQPINEEHETKPVNPYGWSKLMVEQILNDFSRAYGLKYISLRYFCAAGATSENGELRKSKETHLIPLIVDSILSKGNHVKVFGNDYPTKDGTGVRDYLHVLDIAKAHILALEFLDNHSNEVFNLGSETGYSVLDVLDTAKKVLDFEITHKIAPRRSGDPASLVSSSQKARDILNWDRDYTLEDMIRSTYEWRKNPKY